MLVTKVPRIVIQPPDGFNKKSNPSNLLYEFSLMDLEDFPDVLNKCKEIIDKVRDSTQTWGFFPGD